MFLKVLFPVLAVIVISYIVSRYKKIGAYELSVLAIYILTPALILRSFDMYGDLLLGNIAITTIHLVIQAIVMYLLSSLVSRMMRLSRRSKYAFIIMSFLPNTGNIGIPVIELYLGTKASSYATLILVITSIMTQTYCVYLASRGVHSRGNSLKDVLTSVKNILSLPLIYVFLFGITLSVANIKLPFFLKDPIYGVGFSALILGLIQLGVVLGRVRIRLIPINFVIITGLMKLIVSPIVAFGIAYILGVSGTELKVIILQYAMPSALYSSIIASFFKLIPRTVGVSVFFSTVAGFLTLYALIEILSLF
ncbi:MAG: AEC family transporter [Spirochaetes bacterium]|nr:AEC family transporter [Spirochaetota bacterium]